MGISASVEAEIRQQIVALAELYSSGDPHRTARVAASLGMDFLRDKGLSGKVKLIECTRSSFNSRRVFMACEMLSNIIPEDIPYDDRKYVTVLPAQQVLPPPRGEILDLDKIEDKWATRAYAAVNRALIVSDVEMSLEFGIAILCTVESTDGMQFYNRQCSKKNDFSICPLWASDDMAPAGRQELCRRPCLMEYASAEGLEAHLTTTKVHVAEGSSKPSVAMLLSLLQSMPMLVLECGFCDKQFLVAWHFLEHVLCRHPSLVNSKLRRQASCKEENANFLCTFPGCAKVRHTMTRLLVHWFATHRPFVDKISASDIQRIQSRSATSPSLCRVVPCVHAPTVSVSVPPTETAARMSK